MRPRGGLHAYSIVSWPAILPGLALAIVLAVVAVRQQPPAPDVAGRCVAAIACLLFLKLFWWVARDGDGFVREQRLFAFVGFLGIVGGWYASVQAISEKAFDYRVLVQRQQLEAGSRNLSREIVGFLDGRQHLAPPVPRPATWERDEATWLRFEDQTVALYTERFGARVRVAHDLLSLRNMRDRDLDAFYRSPANAFQMRVIAQRLNLMADRLERQDRPPS